MDRQLLAMEGSSDPTQQSSVAIIVVVAATILLIAPLLALCGICGEKPPKHNKGPKPYVTHTLTQPVGPLDGPQGAVDGQQAPAHKPSNATAPPMPPSQGPQRPAGIAPGILQRVSMPIALCG